MDLPLVILLPAAGMTWNALVLYGRATAPLPAPAVRQDVIEIIVPADIDSADVTLMYQPHGRPEHDANAATGVVLTVTAKASKLPQPGRLPFLLRTARRDEFGLTLEPAHLLEDLDVLPALASDGYDTGVVPVGGASD